MFHYLLDLHNPLASKKVVASSDMGGLVPSPTALIASIISCSPPAGGVYPDSGEIPPGSPNSGGISDITGAPPSDVIVGGSPIGPSPTGW